MDREQAETYLRCLAEAELRCGTRSIRFSEAVRALTAVGAVDAELADAIGYDLELARRARQQAPQSGLSRFSPVPVSMMPAQVGRMIRHRAQAAQASPATSIVVPAGLRVPVRCGDVCTEIFLLAYLRSASGARIAIHSRGTDEGDPGIWLRAQGLTVSDDSGRRYSLHFLGSGGGGEWNGELWFDVVPPAGTRRLNMILAGKPAGRISLDRATAKPATTMTGTVLTPGEHYLHGVACRLLCGDPPTRGIGAAAGALLAADALAADSAVPGQLAALCKRLQFTDHGIDAAPAAELPGRWLSVLTSDRQASGSRSCAAIAVTLPELDGSTITVLGLHDNGEQTVLHVHATALGPDASFMPQLWLLDDGGHWHVADADGWRWASGDPTSYLPVAPPLGRPARVEIIAAGRSAEVRANVPLQWR
jgi:hypothetical protein